MRLPASYLCSFPGLGEKPANRSGSRVVLFDFFYSLRPGSGLQDVSQRGTIPFAQPYFLLFFTDIFSYVLYHDGSDAGTFDSSANL